MDLLWRCVIGFAVLLLLILFYAFYNMQKEMERIKMKLKLGASQEWVQTYVYESLHPTPPHPALETPPLDLDASMLQ